MIKIEKAIDRCRGCKKRKPQPVLHIVMTPPLGRDASETLDEFLCPKHLAELILEVVSGPTPDDSIPF